MLGYDCAKVRKLDKRCDCQNHVDCLLSLTVLPDASAKSLFSSTLTIANDGRSSGS